MKGRSVRRVENRCLAGMKPQSQSLAQHKPGVMVYVCNPSILELEKGEPEVHNHPQLHTKFKANLGNKNIHEVVF